MSIGEWNTATGLTRAREKNGRRCVALHCTSQFTQFTRFTRFTRLLLTCFWIAPTINLQPRALE